MRAIGRKGCQTLRLCFFWKKSRRIYWRASLFNGYIFTLVENFILESIFKVHFWNLTFNFFHSPLKRVIHPSITLFQITLIEYSPFKRVIHPFWGWFTLIEGWFTLKGECVHPFWRVNLLSRDSFTLREGWFTLQKGWMEGWIGWITLRRVNEGSHNTL